MSDLLSASSLYLAVLGMLYGAWYSEIQSILSAKIPDFKEDRRPTIAATKAALNSKTIPLSVASLALSLILLPDTITVLLDSIRLVHEKGLGAARYYDATRTLFVAITFLTIGLTFQVLSLMTRLKRRLGSLEE